MDLVAGRVDLNYYLRLLEHLVRLELTHTAWKAVVLATNTKDAYTDFAFPFKFN